MSIHFSALRLVLALCCLILGLLPAHAIQFSFPVACKPHIDCFLFYFVDVDPSSGIRDYHGGDLTYNSHTGTDIALKTYSTMQKGVAVLAAADGKVLRVRDGQPNIMRGEAKKIQSQQCGNGIVIAHEQGFETQYCHLSPNSLRVKPGMHVKRGQAIALVGASGKADFPHLHFVLRKNSHVLCPFQHRLWQTPPQYQGFGLIDMGVTDRIPNKIELLKSTTQKSLNSPDKIIAWVRVYGVHANDEARFLFIQPDGKLYKNAIESSIRKKYVEWFAYAGHKAKTIAFMKGEWQVRYHYRRAKGEWHLLGQQSFTIQ